MTRQEAENFVYRSYLKAESSQEYASKDAQKRNPEYSYDIIRGMLSAPCCVVTGSKGKGSVANMISSVLSSCHRVGLMTSPHLTDFCERFRVDGEMIADDEFCDCMDAIQPLFDAVEATIPRDRCISPMGIQTALALTYFARKHTDFNVMECGKGARYDDVNNVMHEYAVINTIFLEHTRELGDTVEKIAEDKSYVITGEQRCVYVGPQQESVMQVISERAKALDVTLKVYGRDFEASNIRYSKQGMLFDIILDGLVYNDISVPLMGEHQARNCALALALCKDVLGDGFSLPKVRQCLSSINWAGRMEIINSSPFVLLDACINKASCRNVKEVLKYLEIEHYNVIIGIPDDKDFLGVAMEMSEGAGGIVMTKSQNAHYIFTDNQIKMLAGHGVNAVWASNVRDAFSIAFEGKCPVVVLGTTSFVSEVKVFQALGLGL